MKNEIKNKIYLISLILLGCILIYNSNNTFLPVHGDEWGHLAQGMFIKEENNLGFQHPYYPGYKFHLDYESGYHYYLAGLFTIIPIDPVLIYRYLPMLFFILNSICLYYFVNYFKNERTALLSVLFFITIPSNLNILGNWFAVPLTFSLWMILLYFLNLHKLFHKDIFKDKEIIFIMRCIFLALLMFICYPFALFLTIFISLIYLSTKTNSYTNSYFPKIIILLIGVLIALFIHFISPTGLFFNRNFSQFIYFNNLIHYSSIFGIIGIIGFFVYWKEQKLLALILLFITSNLLAANIINGSFFIPYIRYMYYFCVFLAIFTAFGMNYLFTKYPNILSKLAVFIIIIISITFYYNVPEEVKPYNMITEEDYYILKTIKEGSIIKNEPRLSMAVYPIAKSKALIFEGSNLHNYDLTK